MGQYNIRDLEKLTGVKAHTIRIWEKRYGIVVPHRTSTNIRYYDDEHLKRLLNVSLLVNHGHKISKVSTWTKDQISETLTSIFESDKESLDSVNESRLNGLIVSMMELNEVNFSTIFYSSIKEQGLLNTMTGLVYPLLEKVGIMWGINEINPAQEHFISNLIRQKLLVAIDGLPIPENDRSKFLLFLPEGEMHELGLLIAHYLIREQGLKTYYLGANVPFEDISKINLIAKPDYLIVYFTASDSPEDVKKQLDKYSLNFSSKQILIGGASYLFNDIELPENVRLLSSLENFLEFLSSL